MSKPTRSPLRDMSRPLFSLLLPLEASSRCANTLPLPFVVSGSVRVFGEDASNGGKGWRMKGRDDLANLNANNCGRSVRQTGCSGNPLSPSFSAELVRS